MKFSNLKKYLISFGLSVMMATSAMAAECTTLNQTQVFDLAKSIGSELAFVFEGDTVNKYITSLGGTGVEGTEVVQIFTNEKNSGNVDVVYMDIEGCMIHIHAMAKSEVEKFLIWNEGV
jgi:hypothetical protein